MSVPRALPAAAVILVVAIVSVALSFGRYEDAYGWVAHTSDVRLVLGRAIGRLGDFGGSACADLDADVSEFAALTRDNALQQKRVPELASERRSACDGNDRNALLKTLADADAEERRLMVERRGRLKTLGRWTVGTLIGALAGAIALMVLAWRIQQRALAQVRALAEQLQEIAVTDELTSLYNRRGFALVAEPAFALARRHGKSIALLYADLDGLKTVNDQLGHEHGDRALREFAQILRATFRNTDVIARMGGDEFAVFLYDVNADHIASVRARLDFALSSWNASAAGTMHLAASIGVAQAIGRNDSLDDLLQAADARMYVEKRGRREKAGPSSGTRVAIE